MTKKNSKTQEVAPKEHGGACPTCGHCKCCEKKAAAAITFPPICTRPHYDWTYRPMWTVSSGSLITDANGAYTGSSTTVGEN